MAGKGLILPRGGPSLFATIQVRTFSLCLIIPNWEKNCLANQLASPPLRCPSNPALRGDTREEKLCRLRNRRERQGRAGASATPPDWRLPRPCVPIRCTPVPSRVRTHPRTDARTLPPPRPPAPALPETINWTFQAVLAPGGSSKPVQIPSDWYPQAKGCRLTGSGSRLG